jgi:hypothetical protein
VLQDELQSEKASRNSVQRDGEILRVGVLDCFFSRHLVFVQEVIQLYQASLEALHLQTTLVHQVKHLIYHNTTG